MNIPVAGINARREWFMQFLFDTQDRGWQRSNSILKV